MDNTYCFSFRVRRVLFLTLLSLCWLGALRIALTAERSLPGERTTISERGGLLALPEGRTETVKLVNPGFEEGWKAWRPPRQLACSIVTSPGVAHTGRGCLRMDCAQRTGYVPNLRQGLPEVGPGVYLLHFWVKARGVGHVKKRGHRRQGVRVSIIYYLRDGRKVWPSTKVFGGTSDWQRVELRAYLPPELKPGSVAVSIHRYGKPAGGEAFFDDFKLERVKPAPVEAFLLYPNYRGYLPADGPQQVKVWVRLNDGKTRANARIVVRKLAARSVITTSELPAGGEKVVELNAAKWPVGSYAIEVHCGAFAYPSYIVRKISGEQRRKFAVWFDKQNVLHVRGKPAFPLGLYNTTRHFYYRAQDFNFAEESQRLAKMAEAPVNANINYWWWGCEMSARRRYLAEMQKYGIGYLDTVNNVYPGLQYSPCAKELLPNAGPLQTLSTQQIIDEYLTRLARAMRTLPAFLGWYVMDERSFAEVPRYFHHYRVLQRADPDHPTFGVSNKPTELHFWRDTLDVFGVDPYPLINMKAGRPLSMVGVYTRAAVEATRHSRPVWTVIQFFQGWRTDRWPTEEELRTMSLMAIVEGARGLFYWSFGARGLMSVKDSEQSEAYWQRLVKVMNELKSLEPVLLAPDAPQQVKSVSDDRVRWRARLAKNKLYVFAYLPAQKFNERLEQSPTKITFVLANDKKVTHNFRPDSADWFAVEVE